MPELDVVRVYSIKNRVQLTLHTRGLSHAHPSRINMHVFCLFKAKQRSSGQSICDMMALPRHPFHCEIVFDQLFTQTLKPQIRNVMEIFRENPFRRLMVSCHSEMSTAFQIIGKFINCKVNRGSFSVAEPPVAELRPSTPSRRRPESGLCAQSQSQTVGASGSGTSRARAPLVALATPLWTPEYPWPEWS